MCLAVTMNDHELTLPTVLHSDGCNRHRRFFFSFKELGLKQAWLSVAECTRLVIVRSQVRSGFGNGGRSILFSSVNFFVLTSTSLSDTSTPTPVLPQ